MTIRDDIIQHPSPGARKVLFRGDTLAFDLILKDSEKGSAWLRTNIGNAATTRKEIIAEVDRGEAPMGMDWFDIPMAREGDGRFRVTLPLCEIGHFEGKCFFLPERQKEPVWPEGGNVEINVAPAHTCCANIIYNAFVRQFGPNKDGRFTEPAREPWIRDLDHAGYTVIPPSGTFRDLIEALDFIIGRLGCRIIQLLPIHPTPTTFARMGRFGSPYASLSFTQVDPALAQFDPKATPLDQFIELVDAVHTHNALLFIDIAINHTGWAAGLHETHPQWLARNAVGEIEVPGAWGVKWADLTRLDYTHKDLWQYMAEIFIKWCRRGVDGFRCDAGYMIPTSAWRYIIASVRQQFPSTVFVLEGLGGKISVTRELLNKANFTWSYSELFQNDNREQIENYLPEAMDISRSDGVTVHFAETHDNNRMASRSVAYARMRTALCALLSHQGAFGFANGVEWLATEKINVHEARSLNWDAACNQVDLIHRISVLLKVHPAFHPGTEMKMIQKGDGNSIVMVRHHGFSGKRLIVVANLTDENSSPGWWNEQDAGTTTDTFTDLITGKRFTLERKGAMVGLSLEPAQVVCLSPDPQDIRMVADDTTENLLSPQRTIRQRLRAKALEVFRFFHGVKDMGDFDPDRAATELEKDPVAFCRHINPDGDEPRVIQWQWPRDMHREVMVPPDHFLLIRSPRHFRAHIEEKDRVLAVQENATSSDGTRFALFAPLPPKNRHYTCMLNISVFSPEGPHHGKATLLYLAPWDRVKVKTAFNRSHISSRPLLMLGTNGRGGMLRAHVKWGEITSRYDALLAGNPDPEIPVDRWVMFTRCRVWLVYQGYSQELGCNCLNGFGMDPRSRGIWDFQVPSGQGEHVRLTAGMEMVAGESRMKIVFHRQPAGNRRPLLADEKAIKLIIRPDIEDRNFHDTTKAYAGPEQRFPEMIASSGNGFVFSPAPNRQLGIKVSHGTFVKEPEWQYMVHRSMEAQRGLDSASDLFSPGYFSVMLRGDESVELVAGMDDPPSQKESPRTDLDAPVKLPFPASCPAQTLAHTLNRALDSFVVKRGVLKSVIAGYPWFLDWGRDSLIVVRGLIAAGRTDEARDVLKQFGRFEKDGTIPNMIQGNNAANRDTSDAPLWFAVACGDLLCAEGGHRFLDEDCQGRSFRHILLDIGRAYVQGTSNGIRMDPDSGLVFSPTHFTWMDTAHPAGTPREGYPIEIQALWFASLTLLAEIDGHPASSDWQALADRVQESIANLFWLDRAGYLSDCLHATPGTPAKNATPDDALRPNQLFAVTLGAVDDNLFGRKLLSACQELLVPGAVRSLADRPVERPIEIWHNNALLNDPNNPYQGHYKGDEDTRRKPAYHNGTAWTWPFPAFCEAWAQTYGRPGRTTALNWLASASRILNQGCLGQVPEIVDGNRPHHQRGCDAQAWGASELLRVWLKLSGKA